MLADSSEEQPKALKSRRHISLSKKKVFSFVVFLVFLGSVVGFIWSFTSYQDLKEQLADISALQGQQLSQVQIDSLLAAVGRHIILPEEQPTIATIQDIETLVQQQPVFEGAENGDRLLVYQNQAFIYNPTRDILVKVVPVVVQNTDGAVQEDGAKGEPVSQEPAVDSSIITLDIRNGSTIPGLARTLANQLAFNSAYTVINIASASRDDYSGNTLVNVSGKDVSALEQELGLLATTVLPNGEISTQADAVIIQGNP